MGNQSLYETHRIPFVGVAFLCLLLTTRVFATNPEFVAVQVTFVDRVEIRAADDGTSGENLAGLIVNDTTRQASSIVVDSDDDRFDVTFSYQ